MIMWCLKEQTHSKLRKEGSNNEKHIKSKKSSFFQFDLFQITKTCQDFNQKSTESTHDNNRSNFKNLLIRYLHLFFHTVYVYIFYSFFLTIENQNTFVSLTQSSSILPKNDCKYPVNVLLCIYIWKTSLELVCVEVSHHINLWVLSYSNQ